jgi:hypothetical protein
MLTIIWGASHKKPIPSVRTHSKTHPKNRKYKQNNFHLLPRIISLLFVIASNGPMESLSAMM